MSAALSSTMPRDAIKVAPGRLRSDHAKEFIHRPTGQGPTSAEKEVRSRGCPRVRLTPRPPPSPDQFALANAPAHAFGVSGRNEASRARGTSPVARRAQASARHGDTTSPAILGVRRRRCGQRQMAMSSTARGGASVRPARSGRRCPPQDQSPLSALKINPPPRAAADRSPAARRWSAFGLHQQVYPCAGAAATEPTRQCRSRR